MVESHQLSYYYKHRAERSLYAKQYYRAKKLQTSGEKKVRKKYRTWKSNNDKIQEYKQYLQENQIRSVTISFFD
jgi:hypothetical protein